MQWLRNWSRQGRPHHAGCSVGTFIPVAALVDRFLAPLRAVFAVLPLCPWGVKCYDGTMQRKCLAWVGGLGLSLLSLWGCATARPRFDPEIQAAVATDMRRLETEDVVLYYPDGAQREARRIGDRLDRCVRAIRARTKLDNDWSRQKPRVVLPNVPYNNAHVAPPLGMEPISVVPTYSTTELFALLGIVPDPGVVGCHEMVHYVQILQAGGLGYTISSILGPVYSPQLGLDSWFQEGLAVFYETKLQPGMGRLRSRYFEGILAAGTADEGLDSGLPSVFHREPLYGGPYLVGSAFIDWLVAVYGEEALFALVKEQGNSIFFPMFVESRFKKIYGRSLTSLFQEFMAALKLKFPEHARPPEQRLVLTTESMGHDARYTRGRSGHEAFVTQGLDRPTRLVVRAPDGTTVIERNLTDLFPGRTFVAPSASLASGLSFTADGSRLYFVMIDRGSVYLGSRLAVVDIATKSVEIVADDLSGSGGSVSPDGTTYYFARAHGDAWGIAALDLRDKSVRWVRAPETQYFHTSVRVSPDGSRLAVVRGNTAGYWIAVVDARSGALVRELPMHENTSLAPDWVDDQRLLFTAASGGRMQIHVAELGSGTIVPISRAPYLAFAPQAYGGTIRFLNREGWAWSLDEIPLPPATPPNSEVGPAGTVASAAIDGRPPVPPSRATTSASELPLEPAKFGEDEPYSGFERLFYPTLRSPWIASRGAGTILGVGLSGGDVLGWHRWGLRLGVNLGSRLPSGEVSYVNGQLAPVEIGAAAGHYAVRERIRVDDEVYDRIDPATRQPIDRHETLVLADVRRTYFQSTTVATGLRFDSLVRTLEDHAAPLDDRRFGGYFASLAYGAGEGTPYTGARRALAGSVSGTMFPALWEDFGLGDGRATLHVTHHLGLRRLIGELSLRGRYLAGAPTEAALLQIGGDNPVSPELRDSTNAPPPGDDIAGLLPPELRFLEPLAGFEDHAFYDTGAALGEVSIRYPIIADWGSLSTFYFLPSFMLRQVDVVAFADAARLVQADRLAAAAGGRLLVRTAFWVAPLTFQFQLARRLTDDEALAYKFSLLVE